MIQVKLMVDLGNSETRAVAQIMEEGQVLHTRGYLLENRFVVEPLITKGNFEQYFGSEDFSKLDSNILELRLNQGSLKFEKLIIWGELAVKNLSKKLRPPVSGRAKADTEQNYVILINLMDKVLDWVSTYYRSLSKIELAQEVQFDLALLVPPAQASTARSSFERNFQKTITYTNVYDKAELTLNIGSIMVLAEGYASFYSVFMSYATGRTRAEYADLGSRDVLVIDFGEGTTDLIGVSQQRLLEGLKHTIKIGGSTVVSKVRTLVNQKLGFDIPVSNFRDVLHTCEVYYGSSTYDVHEEVNSAIYSVASDMTVEILNYLRGADVEVSSFDRLLLVGGGVVSNGSTVTISEALLSQLKEELPALDLVDLSYLKEPEVIGIPFDLTSPRYLNISGLLTGVSLAQKVGKK